MSTTTTARKVAGTHSTNVRRLPLSALFVDRAVDRDGAYQRSLHENRSKKMEAEFYEALCNPFVVSDREDGTYAVLDGQHRLETLYLLGETHWDCKILQGLTIQQEADIFIRLQTQSHKPTRIERHVAALVAEDEAALRIEKVMRKEGFRIADSDGAGSLRCVGSLYIAEKAYGADTLGLALHIIAAAWGKDDQTALTAPMVHGMACLLHHHSSEMDIPSFVTKLRTHRSVKVVSEIRAKSEFASGGDKAPIRGARTLGEIYNNRRRSNRINLRGLGDTS